jgi:hypothetical protein
MIRAMRTYKTKPGVSSRFLKVFHSKTTLPHRQIGKKVLDPFHSVKHSDRFFLQAPLPLPALT